MMSAKILTYSVSDDETVAELQQRIEKDTGIPVGSQELLLEAGLALEAHSLAAQCAVDYSVKPEDADFIERNLPSAVVAADSGFTLQEIDGRRTDLPLVFLFDRSSCSYKPQLAPRTLPENIRFVRECTGGVCISISLLIYPSLITVKMSVDIYDF